MAASLSGSSEALEDMFRCLTALIISSAWSISLLVGIDPLENSSEPRALLMDTSGPEKTRGFRARGLTSSSSRWYVLSDILLESTLYSNTPALGALEFTDRDLVSVLLLALRSCCAVLTSCCLTFRLLSASRWNMEGGTWRTAHLPVGPLRLT